MDIGCILGKEQRVKSRVNIKLIGSMIVLSLLGSFSIVQGSSRYVSLSSAMLVARLKLDFSHSWVISKKLFEHIREQLSDGSTILELGSGWGSGQLAKHYTVYSVEHDTKWLNQYETNYIHAPIKNRWYDTEVLKSQLPQSYDLLLIDGPPQSIGRSGFLKHLDLFDLSVPIIVDDVHRTTERTILNTLAKQLGRTPTIVSCGNKKFGILPLPIP